MDFPLLDLMDEPAGYDFPRGPAAPRRAGLSRLWPPPQLRRSPLPPRARARLPLRALRPGLQRLDRHGPAGHPEDPRPTGAAARHHPRDADGPVGPGTGLRPQAPAG